MPTVSLKPSYEKTHAYWGGVFAMTLCVFVLLASEFMPVSLLTPIASDLQQGKELLSLVRWRY